MELEDRDTALKRKDVEACDQSKHPFVRQNQSKQPLKCIVIDKDWPKYEFTLTALTKRVDSTS